MIIRRYDEPGAKPYEVVTFKSRLYEVGAKVLFINHQGEAHRVRVVHYA